MYWEINKSWSYNALFNFIVGNRGAGKTYGSKQKAINDFLKNGSQFMYVRRYKTELKAKKIAKFFDDIKENYPEHEFEVKNGIFYCDKKEMGTYTALSTAKIEKSVSFPKINLIIFDEFILDKGNYHYLSDEVVNFLELYETVARTRDVKVYFLSNAITISNPYFLYFNLKIPYGKTITYKDDVLIELVQNKEFIEMKENTRFGKIIKNTDYGKYAIENEFLRDNKEFIEKKHGNCRYLFTIKYKKILYGLWVNASQGKIYVSYDIQEDYPYIFVLSKDDLTPNTMLIHNLRTNKNFKFFIDNYKLANVYYENIKIKNEMNEVIALANIY